MLGTGYRRQMRTRCDVRRSRRGKQDMVDAFMGKKIRLSRRVSVQWFPLHQSHAEGIAHT
jgi:hypothetical protein